MEKIKQPDLLEQKNIVKITICGSFSQKTSFFHFSQTVCSFWSQDDL